MIRPKSRSIFDIHNPLGVKLLSRLRLGLSHLHDHKFKHYFQDCFSPICHCGRDFENIKHFFFHCVNYNLERQTLFDSISYIKPDYLVLNETELINLILYANSFLASFKNKKILQSTIKFVLQSNDLQT